MCFVLLFAISAYAEEVEAAKKSPARLLPANPFVVIDIPDVKGLLSELQTTQVAKSLKEPGMMDLVRLIYLPSMMFMDINVTEVEKSIGEVISVLSGEACYGRYYPFEGEPYSVFVLGTIGNEKKVTDTFIRYMKLCGIDDITDQEEAGLTLYYLLDTISFFFIEDCLVFITDARAFYRVIDAGKGIRTFEGSVAQKLMHAESQGGSLMSAYFNTRALLDTYVDKGDVWQRERALCGFDRIDGIVASVIVKDGRFHERTVILRNGAPTGLFVPLVRQPVRSRVESVPANAFLYFSQSVDMLQLYQNLLALDDIYFSEEGNINFWMDDLRDRTGINFDEFLKNTVADDFQIYLEFPQNAIVPEVVLDLKLKDEARFSQAFAKIQEACDGGIKMSAWNDKQLYWIPKNDILPIQPSITTHVGSLLFANGVVSLKNLLNRKIGENHIGSVPAYRELTALLPQNGHTNLFINLKVIGEKLMPSLMIIKEAMNERIEFEPPIWEDVEQYFSGIAATAYLRENDVVINAVGDLPFLSLASFGLTQLMKEIASISVLLSDWLVVPNNLKTTSEKNLKELYALLKVYAVEHDNNFPPTLGDIANGVEISVFQAPEHKSVVNPADIDGTSDFFYFPNRLEDANMILAANRYSIGKGLRYVLYCDGQIKQLADEQVEELIRQYNRLKGTTIKLQKGVLKR